LRRKVEGNERSERKNDLWKHSETVVRCTGSLFGNDADKSHGQSVKKRTERVAYGGDRRVSC